MRARALIRFIPDCLILLRRLAADPAIPLRRRAVLLALAGYLAMPIDLIPDFIPVIGQADDALIAALALRFVVRGGGSELVERAWPGPPETLALVLRAAGLPGRR